MPIIPSNVEGTIFDWTKLRIVVDNKFYPGLKEVKYSIENAIDNVYGQGRLPFARKGGQVKFDASMTMFSADGDDLEAQLGDGWMDKDFNVSMQYKIAETGRISTVTLERCRMKKTEGGSTNAADPDEAPIDLLPFNIIKNKRSAVLNPFATDFFNSL